MVVPKLNPTTSLDLRQNPFRIKDILGKNTPPEPESEYYVSSIQSLAPFEEEEEIKPEELPFAPEQPKKQDSAVLGKVYDYVHWFLGLFYTPEAKPVQTLKIASEEQEEEEDAPKMPSKPISPCPRLQAPDHFDVHALQKTLAAVDHLLYQIKETNEDGHEHTKEDPNGNKIVTRSLFQPIEAKQDLSQQNGSDSDSGDPSLKQEVDLNAEEAYLHKEFMRLMHVEGELAQENLKILTKLVSISVKTNKELEKAYFSILDDKNARKKSAKIIKWLDGILTGCMMASSVGGVVMMIAFPPSAVLVVIAGALQAGVSLGKGSTELTQAILQHKNRKLISEMYGVSLDRHQNNKQMEFYIRGLQDSLNRVKDSWGERIKLLKQRQRALKIDV